MYFHLFTSAVSSVAFVCSSEFYCLYCWRLYFMWQRVPAKSLYPYLVVLLLISASVINSDLLFNLGDHTVRCYFNITACLVHAGDTCRRIFCVCSASASPFMPYYRSSQDKQVYNWSPSSFWKRGICLHSFKEDWSKNKRTQKSHESVFYILLFCLVIGKCAFSASANKLILGKPAPF